MAQRSTRSPQRCTEVHRGTLRSTVVNRGPLRLPEVHRGILRSTVVNRGPSRLPEVHRGPKVSTEVHRDPLWSTVNEVHREPQVSTEVHRGPLGSRVAEIHRDPGQLLASSATCGTCAACVSRPTCAAESKTLGPKWLRNICLEPMLVLCLCTAVSRVFVVIFRA